MRRISRKAVREKYRQLTLELIEKKLTITTMESCTGGLIASLLTDTEGASAIMKGAFVTYSNEAKIMQGVPEETIEKYGVYSRETAHMMAVSCWRAYKADLAVGVTGSFSNPDPNNADSVPGEVHFVVIDIRNKSDYYSSITLPSLPDRLSCKLYVAERIADLLKNVIE